MELRITKPNWIIHCVFDEDKVAYHTHGLNVYGSPELELNLPLEEKQACHFINLIGLEIANGKELKDGDIDETMFSCKVAFKEAIGVFGNGEKNLRIIFPDANFKFPWDEGCQEPYKSQI